AASQKRATAELAKEEEEERGAGRKGGAAQAPLERAGFWFQPLFRLCVPGASAPSANAHETDDGRLVLRAGAAQQPALSRLRTAPAADPT
ncbi:hypothetical protein EV177_009491, partial [Coemansia sp. RSA 1804]